MKKITILTLSLLLLITPYTTIAHPAPQLLTQPPPEWYDGQFQGKIVNILTQDKHNLTGTITLGKTNTRGQFTATINAPQETITATGIFTKNFLIGTLTSNTTKTPFFGKITIIECSFSATLWAPLKGLYHLYSHYDASFLYPLTGPHSIGVTTYHLIDESRPENFTEDPTDFREMMMQVWYPTPEKNFSYPSQPYMDYPTFQWLKDRSPIPLITIPNNAYTFVQTHARIEPPVQPNNAPYPLIIFSHGYDGVYQIYTSLIEDLVSNGYIVASINHPYIAGVTVFPDNRTIPVSRIPIDPIERDKWLTLGQNSVVGDAKYALDILTDLNTSDPLLQGTIDLSHVGMYGHSFGGGATARCCAEDPRFDAGLTLDGFFTADAIAPGLSTPFLQMVTSDRYNNDTTLSLIWQNLTGPAYLVGINGSQHYSYSDVGILLQHLLPLIPPNLLGFGTINQKRMINITISLEHAFFDTYLKNTPPTTLNTILSTTPEIQFQQK